MALGTKFVKGAATLMSGTVVGQAITFFMSFVLARLYSPSEFGQYSIFLGIAGILGAASTGAFDRVIVLEPSRDEARRAATLALAASVSFSILLLFLSVAVSMLANRLSITPSFSEIIFYIPCFVLFYGLAQVFTFASLREGRNGQLARFKVGQSSVMALVQYVSAGSSWLHGLILGSLAGWALPAFAGLAWRLKQKNVRTDLHAKSLISCANKHIRYPLYVAPNELIDNLSNQIPIVLIGMLVSVSGAGHYGLAIMMLSAPSAVIGQAVGQSFMQYLGQNFQNSSEIRRSMLQIWGTLSAIGFIPFLVLFFFAEDIFMFSFGKKWEFAGEIAQYISILLLVRFVSSPTSTIYLKLGLQKYQFRFCLLAVVYRTAAYGILAFGYDLTSAIMLHVAFEIVAIAAYNGFALKQLRLLDQLQHTNV
jgi:O-antigen/teichoic acid export membrane protein